MGFHDLKPFPQSVPTATVMDLGCPQLRWIRLSPQHLDWRLALPLAMAGVADPLDSCRLIWWSKCSEKQKQQPAP